MRVWISRPRTLQLNLSISYRPVMAELVSWADAAGHPPMSCSAHLPRPVQSINRLGPTSALSLNRRERPAGGFRTSAFWGSGSGFLRVRSERIMTNLVASAMPPTLFWLGQERHRLTDTGCLFATVTKAWTKKGSPLRPETAASFALSCCVESGCLFLLLTRSKCDREKAAPREVLPLPGFGWVVKPIAECCRSSQSYVAAHGVPCVSWIQEKGDGCCNCSRKVSEGREWTFVSVRGATNHKFEYSSMLTDTTCKCRP